MNIILVGPMGVGKTSIGRALAAELKLDFFDSDLEVVQQTGVSINHIFDVEGENGFRDRESQTIAKLVNLSNIVLATGGGCVIDSANRETLKKNSFVVYLSSTIEQLVQRIKNSNDRPLLNTLGVSKKKIISDLIKIREPLYLDVADVNIDVTGKKTANIIKEIKNVIDCKT